MTDLCGLYKATLTNLFEIMEVAYYAVIEDLGSNYNFESLDNYVLSMTQNPPYPEIPADLVKPEGCDAYTEEHDYLNIAMNLDIAQQFASWCDANPGSVMDGLCGPSEFP